MMKTRLCQLAMVFVLALGFCALRTMTVLADDEATPAASPTVVTQPTDSSPAGDTTMPVDLSTVVDTSTPAPTVQAPTVQAATDVTAIEATDTSPSGDTSTPVATSTPTATDVTATTGTDTSTPVDLSTLVDTSTPVPTNPGTTSLTTDLDKDPRAALLVPVESGSAGDPIWCPNGVAPIANMGGCTASFTSFNYIDSGNTGLISAMSGKVTAGTIWVASSYAGGEFQIFLDSTHVGTITVTYPLTIQGGWNGTSGNKTISGNSIFELTALIIDWKAAVTLNNITVQDITSGQDALDVSTTGNLTLSNVKVNNNSGASGGAQLGNWQSGTVTILNSDFSNNPGSSTDPGLGLAVYTHGDIVLTNVSANNNGADGMWLDNSGANPAKKVTVTSSQINNNGTMGLTINSSGAVTLKDIDAVGNKNGYGVHVDNHYAASAQPVTLSSTNIFSENKGDGLDVISLGAITANNLVANGNAGWGVWLDNHSSVAVQPVTLTGTSNQFKFNAGGLDIASKGNITLNSITANGNTGDNGATIDNCQFDSGSGKCLGNGNVTLSGTNAFENNYNIGLKITTAGTITTTNLSADGNTSGAVLDNTLATAPKTVTLNGVNSFSNNAGTGLSITTLGNIVTNNLTANNNSNGDGVDLNNHKTGSTGTVTVSGNNMFKDNNGKGLYIQSYGAITTNNLDAEENVLEGTHIISDGHSNQPAVKVNGNNTFNSNCKNTVSCAAGLFIVGGGTTSINNVIANENYTNGVDIIDSGSVTLSGSNVFSGNDGIGLWVQIAGTITANNLTANSNLNHGVDLDNFLDHGSHSIILTGTNTFNYNGIREGELDVNADGLLLETYGNMTLSNVTATGNGGDGVYTKTWEYTDTKNYLGGSFTLTGTNNFNYNGLNISGQGLYVLTWGIVNISNLNANANGGDGADLDNSAYFKSLTLSGTNEFFANGGNGLVIRSTGTIVTNNLDVEGNGGNGATIDNCLYDGSNCNYKSPANITLNGNNQFIGNTDSGLFVTTNGAIKANSLNSSSNGFNGAYLDDQWQYASGGITLTGNNTFSTNAAMGLELYSIGAVSLNNLTANNNAGGGYYAEAGGVYINTIASVSMTGTNTFNYNGSSSNPYDGLDVEAMGNINLNNVTAIGNADSGTALDNCWLDTSTNACDGTGSITLTGTNQFSDNGAYGTDNTGLFAGSTKNITLNSVTADNNGSIGVCAISYTSITILGGSMTNNKSYGWILGAPTTITIKGVFAYGNNGGAGNTDFN